MQITKNRNHWLFTSSSTGNGYTNRGTLIPRVLLSNARKLTTETMPWRTSKISPSEGGRAYLLPPALTWHRGKDTAEDRGRVTRHQGCGGEAQATGEGAQRGLGPDHTLTAAAGTHLRAHMCQNSELHVKKSDSHCT